MPTRYLEADKVELPARAPLFVEEGHCLWCNKELPKDRKATRFCPVTEQPDLPYYMIRHDSECCINFSHYWYSRPSYQRATFIRDNFTCQICGYHQMREDKPWLPDMTNLECDHIVPLARGGQTELSNLQTLCRGCNRHKGIKILSKEVVEDGDNGHKPLPQSYKSVWLTNGTVAWLIGDRRLAYLYRFNFYLVPEGWWLRVGCLSKEWYQGECREMRLKAMEV